MMNKNMVADNVKMEENNKININNLPYIFQSTIFKIVSLKDKNISVRCNHCKNNKIVKGNIRSTGNFLSHLKRKHPDLIHQVQKFKKGDKQNQIDPLTSDLLEDKFKNQEKNVPNTIKNKYKIEITDEGYAYAQSSNSAISIIRESSSERAVDTEHILPEDVIENVSDVVETNSIDSKQQNTAILLPLPTGTFNDNDNCLNNNNNNNNNHNHNNNNNNNNKEFNISDEYRSTEYIFGQYIGQEMIGLSEELKIKTKFKINTILYEAQLENINFKKTK